MDNLEQNKILFDATYSPNTERARKELTKSVFVASSPSDIRVFTYCSAYKIADEESLVQCENSDISQDKAIEEATKKLTGLSTQDYSQKIDELFLEKRESYKEMKMIWENYNFPTLDLDFSSLHNYGNIDMASYQPKNMLKHGLDYIYDASIFHYRSQEFEDTVSILDDGLDEFLFSLNHKAEVADEIRFFRYLKNILKKMQKNLIEPKAPKEIYYNAAKAIGISESYLEEFIVICQKLESSELIKEANFAKTMLYTYWNFQKKVKESRLRFKGSSVLYYGRYAKDFINLYEDNFFRHSEESKDEIKHGVSLWAELNTQGSKTCSDSLITNSTLSVVFAKTYVDGSTETVATLYFDYTICFYKDERSGEVFPSKNNNIMSAVGNQIYHVLSQQFYPLYGMKGEGISKLVEQLTIDEGERGGILNLRDINISSKYSDRIIPELIKGVYDLIQYNSSSSFPVFSCMVGGDVIVNDELFPVIKSPLLTVVSSTYLAKRIQKIQADANNDNSNYIDFDSEYKGNTHHYYNRMTFDPLRPILVY